MHCALQTPLKVETNLRDKACRRVKRRMGSRAAQNQGGSVAKESRMCRRAGANEQVGVGGGAGRVEPGAFVQ